MAGLPAEQTLEAAKELLRVNKKPQHSLDASQVSASEEEARQDVFGG